MKTNILKSLMLIAALLTSTHASAYDFEVDGIYYDITSETDLTVEVTFKGDSEGEYTNEYTDNVVIPETVVYNGITYSVTSIGYNAFVFCSGLTSITIPNSVTKIVSNPFYNCTGLTSIIVESENTVYDSRNNCNAIIETETNTLITGCKNTIIPSSITSIGDGAFEYCSGLTSITIPNSVSSIGDYAFACCYSLTSITIPNSVTSIGGTAFSYCTGLTSIAIPNSVTCIGPNAFYNTAWYNNQPDGILYLDNCCLGYKGDRPIGSLTLNVGTRLIQEGAFNNCDGLTSVTIPNSVTSISNNAFISCDGLTEIICKNATPPTVGRYSFMNVVGVTLYVPAGSKDAYASATGWMFASNIVEMEEPVITIMDASNQGAVSLIYEYDKPFEFTVSPVKGYIINSVSVNGKEIQASESGTYTIESVSGATTISVSYELDTATRVNTLNTCNVKVYGYYNTLTVTGTEYGDTIRVYDLNGVMLHTLSAIGSATNIQLDKNGIYIVKVNNQSFKVAL